jgi:hypothetical protein
MLDAAQMHIGIQWSPSGLSSAQNRIDPRSKGQASAKSMINLTAVSR